MYIALFIVVKFGALKVKNNDFECFFAGDVFKSTRIMTNERGREREGRGLVYYIIACI